MRTRIALVAVFTVAIIISISSAVLIRPVSSQAASTAPHQTSTPTSSIPSALVAFDSSNSSGSHATTVSGLGALLSLGTGQVAAASTKAAPVAAAPAPVATPAPVVLPAPTPAPAPATPAPAPAPAPVAPVSNTTSSASADPTYTEWSRVAVCEEGGWVGAASADYPDSLGINATNWYANGGGSDVSPAAQIAVAQRIEGTSYVPDQNGCGSW